MDQSEEHLLKRAREFDLDALAELYERYSPRVYNYINHRVGDPVLAEEMTSDVFLRMLEAIRSGKDWRTSFSGWLFRIAHNRVVDHYRRKARVPQPQELGEQITSGQDEPLEGVEREATRAEVREALSRLPEHQALVLSLRFIEGFSIAEVSRMLGRSEGAIKALQYRGLTGLRRLLRGREG